MDRTLHEGTDIIPLKFARSDDQQQYLNYKAGQFAVIDLGTKEDYSRPVVLLSGDIGVTPFRSMIKYAADKQLPRTLRCLIPIEIKIISFIKKNSTKCVNATKNLKIIYTITGEGQEGSSSFYSTIDANWKGESGFINRDANQVFDPC